MSLAQRFDHPSTTSRSASTDSSIHPIATVDFHTDGRAGATTIALDVAQVFADFDEEHKGWLAMQDVQAATLALCGFWPTAAHVLDFFARRPATTTTTTADDEHTSGVGGAEAHREASPERARAGATATAEEAGARADSVGAAAAASSSSLPVEWTLQEGEYFRVKSPEMLQHWLLEASKVVAEKEAAQRRSHASAPPPPPPPVLSHAKSHAADSTVGNASGSVALGGVQGPSECGTFTWEEMFDALDVNGDGYLDFSDLVAAAAAAAASPDSSLRGFSLETLTRCLVEMCAAAATERTSGEPRSTGSQHKMQASRRQFLRFMKTSPFNAPLKS